MATAHARLRDIFPDARELAGLAAARGLASVVAFGVGFRALSDDDYARIVIAQRFALRPSLDPSGTSWLPAPFWLYGTVFRAFGLGLGVARATAIALGLCATLAVYLAARLLGTGKSGALTGAVLSCAIVPYALLLGIAAVPEVPCAALLLLSAATLSRPEPGLRALGALSLIGATLMRYEAWPVALVYSLGCAWDARKRHRSAFARCAALALSGIALWLWLGRLEHGDPLFFVARVTAYRRALGEPPASLIQRLFDYPAALFSGAPLLALLLVGLALLPRARNSHRALDYGRGAMAMLGLLSFLILGSVRDGVPTHHAARVLLPIWFFGCVLAGHALDWHTAQVSSRVRLTAVAFLLATALLLVAKSSRSYGFGERALELQAGLVARQFTRDRLAIDTPDYGYFAVQAGFAHPLGTIVLDDHDPRRRTASPFDSALKLDQALRAQGTRFVVAHRDHANSMPARCSSAWNNARFVLFRCN